MLIILNPNSGGGKSLRKWKTVEEELLSRENTQYIQTRSADDLDKILADHLAQGERHFVAAGGDGTVNALLQRLIYYRRVYPDITLGAIGLGSSNDFHKPLLNQKAKIPMKIDFNKLQKRDVGVVRYQGDEQNDHTSYWLLNASIGITAEANVFFNIESGSFAMRTLKKWNTAAAIIYAAIHTIIAYHNHKIKIGTGETATVKNVTNLGIVKSPHFAGDFTYDSPMEPSSGFFYSHLAHDLSTLKTLMLLQKLSKGKFRGFPNTETSKMDMITATAEYPFALEFDGEVRRTRNASFSIIKEGMLIAS